MASDGASLAPSIATAVGGDAADARGYALQVARGSSGESKDGILQQLISNPFFTAGFGLAGLGVAATVGQRGARQAASLLKRRLLVDVEVNINDESYPWLLNWMTSHQQAQLGEGQPSSSGLLRSLTKRLAPRLHHLSVSTDKVVHPNGAVQTQFKLVPGPGRHLMRYREAWLLVNRVRETKAMNLAQGRPWETVTLTTLYAHRHVFEQMFREAHELAQQSTEGKTIVYTARTNSWERFGEPRRKRTLESVILDYGVKDKMVADVEDFLGSGSWYYDRGIPYRRGYLLYGIPGSGKTSFIRALAGELDYNIAILNLSERGLTDDRLNYLLTIIPQRTIVLLEDVDAAFSSRRLQIDADGYQGANVTFSGLLNALDGIASAEERILFLTTNHVERLDEALVRPGRVDMTVYLGEVTRYQVEQFWDRFYGEIDQDQGMKRKFLERLGSLGMIVDEDGRQHGAKRPISAAALQGLFLYNKGDPAGAIAMGEGLVARRPEERDNNMRTHPGTAGAVGVS